jgi:hypothetical protein
MLFFRSRVSVGQFLKYFLFIEDLSIFKIVISIFLTIVENSLLGVSRAPLYSSQFLGIYLVLRGIYFNVFSPWFCVSLWTLDKTAISFHLLRLLEEFWHFVYLDILFKYMSSLLLSLFLVDRWSIQRADVVSTQ